MKKTSLLLILPFLALGCNKSPYDRTTGGVITGTGTGPAAGSLVIFYNELSSGGGSFLFPAGNFQDLNFSDTSDKTISPRSIRYVWTGAAVPHPGCVPNPTFNFAGFDLMHTPLESDYNITPGKDLRGSGFGKVTFYARGSLSAGTLLKIEVASVGTAVGSCVGVTSPCIVLSTNGTDTDPVGSPTCATGLLSSSWQPYVVPVANADLAAVKDYFKATYVFLGGSPGNGGTVYFDRIEYEP